MRRIAIEVASRYGNGHWKPRRAALFIIASPVILNPSLYAVSADDRGDFPVVQFIRDIPRIIRRRARFVPTLPDGLHALRVGRAAVKGERALKTGRERL